MLEIGFGMGEATAHIAALMPETNFLCCEVHEPGVGALLKRIGEQGLTNIRICAHDAVDVLDHMIEPATLAGVHIFFPDPWHKARHNKRRLIQPPTDRRRCSISASVGSRAGTMICRFHVHHACTPPGSGTTAVKPRSA